MFLRIHKCMCCIHPFIMPLHSQRFTSAFIITFTMSHLPPYCTSDLPYACSLLYFLALCHRCCFSVMRFCRSSWFSTICPSSLSSIESHVLLFCHSYVRLSYVLFLVPRFCVALCFERRFGRQRFSSSWSGHRGVVNMCFVDYGVAPLFFFPHRVPP